MYEYIIPRQWQFFPVEFTRGERTPSFSLSSGVPHPPHHVCGIPATNAHCLFCVSFFLSFTQYTHIHTRVWNANSRTFTEYCTDVRGRVCSCMRVCECVSVHTPPPYPPPFRFIYSTISSRTCCYVFFLCKFRVCTYVVRSFWRVVYTTLLRIQAYVLIIYIYISSNASKLVKRRWRHHCQNDNLSPLVRAEFIEPPPRCGEVGESVSILIKISSTHNTNITYYYYYYNTHTHTYSHKLLTLTINNFTPHTLSLHFTVIIGIHCTMKIIRYYMRLYYTRLVYYNTFERYRFVL